MKKTSIDWSKWKDFLTRFSWFRSKDLWDPKEAQKTLKWLENSYAKGDAALYHQRPNLAVVEFCPVPLPTRVLDLFPPSLSTRNLDVRLITTNTEDRGVYVTLSHTWGSEHKLKLTANTLRTMTEGIEFTSLPQTYQHAIIVSRSLGFRYLWIDALCIIQDDEKDWLHEAARMASVYRESSCTISTHAASNDNDGFLHLDRREGGSISLLVTASHLSQRGWVFQERILSRRLLHFTSGGLFLEDASGFKTPDGKTPATELYDPWKDNKLNVEDSQHDPCGWYRLIESFTSCRLTFEMDRLPAVMGLTQFLENNPSEDNYIWGIWSRSMHQGLIWMNVDREPKKLAHTPGSANIAAPSWSWGSWTGRVRFPDHLASCKAECTLENPEVESNNNFREPAEAQAVEQTPLTITLSTRIITLQNVKILRNRTTKYFVGAEFYHSVMDKGLSFVSLDGVRDEDVQFARLTLALVAHHHNIEKMMLDDDLIEIHTWVHYFLLLSASEDAASVFRRVGVAASKWDGGSVYGNVDFPNVVDTSKPVLNPKTQEMFAGAELATIMLR